MRWLYVIQQRISITGTECTALLTIGFLLVLGIVVQEVRRQPASFGDDHYAASDRVFMRAPVMAVDSVVAVREPGEPTEEPEGAEVSKPTEAETPEKPRPTAPPPAAGFRVNINTATAAQLQSLPRIGPKMAERIIEYRTTHGPFRSPHQLLQVRGIGEKTLENLLPLLTVGD